MTPYKLESPAENESRDWSIPDPAQKSAWGFATSEWRVFINESLAPGRVFIDTNAPGGHLDFYVNNTGDLGRKMHALVTLMSLSPVMLEVLRTMPEDAIDHFSDEMKVELVKILEKTRKV